MKFGLITRMLGALAALIIVSPLIALLSKTPWSKFFSSFSDFDAIRPAHAADNRLGIASCSRPRRRESHKWTDHHRRR